MYIDRIKSFVKKIFDQIKSVIDDTCIKTFNLRGNNINQAIDFFELGMLDESYNRLKIILTLWPDDDYAKYLLGLLYIFDRNNEKSVQLLKTVKAYRVDYAKKLISIIEANKVEKIIDKYLETLSLYEVENEIYKIKL